jgi:uncharacterized protein YndB with AHSA1/START domain
MITPKGLVAKAEININASPAKIWQALTDPTIIKQYLFGTEAKSDWQVGSSITYKGQWQGKDYEDKGKILEIVPEKLLVTTYWSSMGGRPDTQENYNTVSYQIDPAEVFTKLTITQDNCLTAESQAHSQKNWTMVLETIKKLLES